MSERRQPSSIDRFFWTRGVGLFGYVRNPMALGFLIASISTLGLGVTMTAISFASGGKMPFVVGLVNILVALVFGGISFWAGRRAKNIPTTEVRLSSQARGLLTRIGQHIGWHDTSHDWDWAGGQAGNFLVGLFGQKTAANVIAAPAAVLLQGACSEYNRVWGLLKIADGSTGRAKQLVPQMRVAADEAMISILNQVSLLDKSPETQGTISAQVGQQTGKLKELADHLEALLSEPASIADRLVSSNVMDGVLDNLRMERVAQEELRDFNSTNN